MEIRSILRYSPNAVHAYPFFGNPTHETQHLSMAGVIVDWHVAAQSAYALHLTPKAIGFALRWWWAGSASGNTMCGFQKMEQTMKTSFRITHPIPHDTFGLFVGCDSGMSCCHMNIQMRINMWQTQAIDIFCYPATSTGIRTMTARMRVVKHDG